MVMVVCRRWRFRSLHPTPTPATGRPWDTHHPTPTLRQTTPEAGHCEGIKKKAVKSLSQKCLRSNEHKMEGRVALISSQVFYPHAKPCPSPCLTSINCRALFQHARTATGRSSLSKRGKLGHPPSLPLIPKQEVPIRLLIATSSKVHTRKLPFQSRVQ